MMFRRKIVNSCLTPLTIFLKDPKENFNDWTKVQLSNVFRTFTKHQTTPRLPDGNRGSLALLTKCEPCSSPIHHQKQKKSPAGKKHPPFSTHNDINPLYIVCYKKSFPSWDFSLVLSALFRRQCPSESEG